MKRDIYTELIKWKNTPGHQPLILSGARQVGKTYILNKFGKNEYKNFSYFNFEKNPELKSFFEDNLEPEKIIEKLSIYQEKKITEDTLIFFDEIQESERAVTALKYFEEEAKYDIVSAGSLLGVKYGQSSPFPVGKVTYLELYPFSFGEFLDGVGKNQLRKLLNNVTGFKPIDEVFHRELISQLKIYLFVGGMPKAINQYNANKDLNMVRKIQLDLLKSYENDFKKYKNASDAVKLTNAWKSIPTQLARENKKFKYTTITKYARAREYNEIITWLTDAGLVLKSFNVGTPKLPLEGYRTVNIFKLFLIDVGLLGAMLKLSQKTIVEDSNLFSEYNGAFTENYAAQELTANGNNNLFYWTSKRMAEIDFLISRDETIYPLEVKSGANIQSKSLKMFKEKYEGFKLSRATIRNFNFDGNYYNYPLYAISLFPSIKQDLF